MRESSLQEFARRLKQARLNAGYRSARQFAMKMDLSEATYRSHESGQRGFSIEQAKRYAAMLGISHYDLIDGVPPADKSAPARAGFGDTGYTGSVWERQRGAKDAASPAAILQKMARYAELIERYEKLSPHLREAVDALIYRAGAQEKTQVRRGKSSGKASVKKGKKSARR